jgi:hypothetical protein
VLHGGFADEPKLSHGRDEGGDKPRKVSLFISRNLCVTVSTSQSTLSRIGLSASLFGACLRAAQETAARNRVVHAVQGDSLCLGNERCVVEIAYITSFSFA